MAVRHRQLEECQEIFNWAKENLTREEVNPLLLATDNNGRTLFHMEIRYRKVEECKKIFNWAKENLTREEVNKLFLATNNKEGRSFILQQNCVK
jgi:endo-1,4-beta-D-glucanase Y